MTDKKSTLTQIKFNDIADLDYLWDVVYKEYGIAFRNEVNQFFIGDKKFKLQVIAFLVCLEGQMECETFGKTFTLIPGKVLIQLPGSIISNYRLSSDFKGKIFCLSPEVFAHHITETGFMDTMMRITANPVIDMGINPDSIRSMDAYETILTIKAKYPGQQHAKRIITHLVECLLYEIFSSIPTTDTWQTRKTHGTKYALFNRFLELIVRDNGRLRSVKLYAEKLNVSPKYLTTVCKSLSGKSAYEWVNGMLKKEIERLLQYSDLTTKEISNTLGFSDLSLFSKYMRQHFHMTAIQYRVMLRSSPQTHQ